MLKHEFGAARRLQREDDVRLGKLFLAIGIESVALVEAELEQFKQTCSVPGDMALDHYHALVSAIGRTGLRL